MDKMRETIIQILLATRQQSEGVTVDAIMAALAQQGAPQHPAEDRPPEPFSSDENPEQWCRVLAWEEERADYWQAKAQQGEQEPVAWMVQAPLKGYERAYIDERRACEYAKAVSGVVRGLVFADACPQPATIPEGQAKAAAVREFCQEIGLFDSAYDDQEYIEVSRYALKEHISMLAAAPEQPLEE